MSAAMSEKRRSELAMPQAIRGAVLAAVVLASGVAAAADPVCGDVNNDSSVKSADALLILKKSVAQPVTLTCSAYDDHHSQCQASLAETKAAGVACLHELDELGQLKNACDSDVTNCGADVTQCNADLPTTNAAFEACLDAVPPCNCELDECSLQLGITGQELADCEKVPHGKARRTGQNTCFNAAGGSVSCAGAGQDGQFQKGLASSFFDNGDGTITDILSGLMWEKLDRNGGIHDMEQTYLYFDAYDKTHDLNEMAFAGHTDWRLPNYNELLSLVNLGAPASPATFSAFHAACVPGCAVTTCSCTSSAIEGYWTSTTHAYSYRRQWLVTFFDGQTYDVPKAQPEQHRARAVRGGY